MPTCNGYEPTMPPKNLFDISEAERQELMAMRQEQEVLKLIPTDQLEALVMGIDPALGSDRSAVTVFKQVQGIDRIIVEGKFLSEETMEEQKNKQTEQVEWAFDAAIHDKNVVLTEAGVEAYGQYEFFVKTAHTDCVDLTSKETDFDRVPFELLDWKAMGYGEE